jgi:predicted metal-binding membrane protein
MSHADEQKWHTIVTGACAVIAGAAWLYLLIGPVPGMASSGDDGAMQMQMAGAPWGATEAFLLVVMWSAMMLAMMLPSATGILPLLSRVGGEENRSSTTLWFAAGYFAVWSAFSAVTAGVQLVMHTLGMMSWTMQAANSFLGSLLLIVAGAYQFHPLKQSCLKRCRSPLDFLMTSWQDGNGGAVRMGVRYGLVCTGCCWVLMLVLFVLGIMNLLVVAALSAVIVLEKMWRLGPQLSRVTGVALIAGGLLTLVI